MSICGWARVFALVTALAISTSIAAEETFRYRGYYLMFTRKRRPLVSTRGKKTIDCVHQDRGNLVILWMGGAFRSKRFPITWRYNHAHANVRGDFLPVLIDYAHARGIKVLLAFTPFAYDGVNQYPFEHPELRARQKNGEPAAPAGIASLGPNLCPAKEESQKFMREYVGEMLFDFYPKADGVLIEASDYAICFGAECSNHSFQHEFRFVSAISREIWERKPDALIVVYPHYFSGSKVPGFGVRAARQPFDPRWILFFTPHSAPPEPILSARRKTAFGGTMRRSFTDWEQVIWK